MAEDQELHVAPKARRVPAVIFPIHGGGPRTDLRFPYRRWVPRRVPSLIRGLGIAIHGTGFGKLPQRRPATSTAHLTVSTGMQGPGARDCLPRGRGSGARHDPGRPSAKPLVRRSGPDAVRSRCEHGHGSRSWLQGHDGTGRAEAPGPRCGGWTVTCCWGPLEGLRQGLSQSVLL
jgi:hypothetical protein